MTLLLKACFLGWLSLYLCMTCTCVRCGAFALHDALCDIQFVFNLYYRFVSEQSGIGTFFILLIWLSAKRCACKGLCTSVENKTLMIFFVFEMLYCAFAWMNEYIVQIISATRLWLISRYSHHTLKKSQKMTTKNRHPWFLSLCLQTNRKHME